MALKATGQDAGRIQRNRERKGLLNKQDCERFATYDTMKAPQEHEPEHG
jgi:hypothetical protein